MVASIFPTLRSRLTFFYIASTILTFLLLSSLFSGLLWIALHNQIDHHIHIVTTQANQIVSNFTGEDRELLLNNLTQMGGMSLILIGQNGEVLMQKYSSDIIPLNSSEVRLIVQESTNIGHHPAHFTMHNQRFGTAEVTTEKDTALLAVGYSTKILRETYTQMTVIVLGVIVLLLVPLAYFARKLLSKYLKPLELIATTAALIDQPKNLSKRVPHFSMTTEVSIIANAFNGMLERLEKIFASEHEFFSDAAHTLKTPLAVLRAKVEGLTKESEAKKQEMIHVIESAVETVQDLLLLSRIEAGTAGGERSINLSSVVAELAELAESLSSEKGVVVTREIQENIFFKAEDRLVKRALANVVDNAVLYVPKKGIITIALAQKNDEIEFSISNTGERLSKEELQHVFDRFYRGSNSKNYNEGSGLGLAITKAVIERYHGKIFIRLDAANTIIVKIVLALL